MRSKKKAKKDRRGLETALDKVEKAHKLGAAIPVELLPIPTKLQKLLQGKTASDIMRVCAPYCAYYLFNCIITKKFKPSWARIDVAKYVIDQVEGKAKIRAEITGPGGVPLTWGALVIMAGRLEDAERLSAGVGTGAGTVEQIVEHIPKKPRAKPVADNKNAYIDTPPLGTTQA